MKKLTSLFFMSILAAGMFSCSSEDDPIAENSLQSSDKVYMTLDLSFPETRSATDENGKGTGETPSNADPDSEVGQKSENKVSTVQLIIVDTKGDKKAVSKNSLVGADGSYIVEFQFEDLQKVAGETVYTYVVCNGSETLDESIEGATFKGDIASIYNTNEFLMTNAEEKAKYTCTLPENFDANKTKTTAFDLSGKTGAIRVERAAARFDFKPTNKNIYDIKKMNTDGTFSSTNSGIQIVLTDVALTNQSNTFYYLRRVGDNTGEKFVIGGLETATNYVVDTDWNTKAALSTNTWADFLKNNHLYKSDNLADFHKNKDLKTFTSLASIATPETNTSWTKDLDYRVWTYTTENTFGLNYKQIQKGAATCIIFKGQLKANDAPEEMKTAFTSGKNLYVYNNTLYGTWTMVTAAAKNHDVVETAYNAAVKLAKAADPGATTEANITNDIAVATGFTVYDAVKQSDGTFIYPVYYYYWNKHNAVDTPTDKDPATPMYYGVVRNNVYKLAVTTINKYGHPHNGSGDPDPIDPVDPIVDDNVYFKVAFEVLPWTVRVNNIEF